MHQVFSNISAQDMTGLTRRFYLTKCSIVFFTLSKITQKWFGSVIFGFLSLTSGQKLCNGDLNRTIKVQLYRYRESAMKSDFWGEMSLTSNDLKSPNLQPRPIGSQSKNTITAHVTWKKIEQQYSFLDYLQHGMQINAIVAIDFTGSNGAPSHPSSLHFVQPQFFNQYENA